MSQDFGASVKFLGLSLGNFASLDRLNGNPHALDFTAWQLDSDALNVRTEFPPSVLNQRSPDTSAFLGKTFTDYTTTLRGSFSCDCANT